MRRQVGGREISRRSRSRRPRSYAIEVRGCAGGRGSAGRAGEDKLVGCRRPRRTLCSHSPPSGPRWSVACLAPTNVRTPSRSHRFKLEVADFRHISSFLAPESPIVSLPSPSVMSSARASPMHDPHVQDDQSQSGVHHSRLEEFERNAEPRYPFLLTYREVKLLGIAGVCIRYFTSHDQC